jgi:hypothetical protein
MNLPGTTQTTSMAILVLAGLLYQSADAVARGGMSHPDVASSQYIEELPPEIRKVVSRWQSACGAPLAARHLFAHYLGDRLIGSRLIALHFHELSCANKSALCSYRGCLHQVYVSTDGRYQLAFSARVPDVTLTLLDHTPAIEIDYSLLDRRCPRVLRWNGRRFVEQ